MLRALYFSRDRFLVLLEKALGELTDYRFSLGIRRGLIVDSLLSLVELVFLVLVQGSLAGLPQKDLTLLGSAETGGMQP